ncbi:MULTISPECIES: hypothetical protein [Crocosphaera]|uniref:Uncharacterized protein n=4 Tax=Crocosphaera watsonii TaxID=263511 RepID=T2JTM7_CROWT|nr:MULTISPECIES: hypothetical protein [Crocosphaera]EHJ09506.1 hypothetical protein CWATWH0003_B067 [Crocosphaera watsonii WH 0003]MCH2244227.1 hypothetical protein [Crocosphaera sp.]NQZ61256.1 hypothetical protein [Crocosphaera sp.]CCQ59242.1 hypothetical protein CWATWH0005_2955 [Crocosphaera watsonii WH 0005]CCQ63789.1 hypothetical protein CWATWH0401_1347 [Crocosphaera watsonii WH 0401]
MINKSLSLFLGMALSLGVLATETLAYPHRMRISPSPGIHRTITAPNTRRGNNYSRGNSYYGDRGNYTFRERIRIERDQRGSCYNCGYSNNYNPYQTYRNRGRNSRVAPNYQYHRYYR